MPESRTLQGSRTSQGSHASQVMTTKPLSCAICKLPGYQACMHCGGGAGCGDDCREVPGARPCTVCGGSAYCTDDCRDMDRPIHAMLCHQYRNVGAPPQRVAGSDEYSLAIVLHETDQRPKFHWVYSGKRGCIYGVQIGEAKEAQAERILFDDALESELEDWREKRITVQYNSRRGIGLSQEDRVEIRMREHHIRQKMDENGTLREVCRMQPRQQIKGPVIITHRKKPGKGEAGTLGSVNLNHFRTAIDYLQSLELTTNAVRLACDGEREVGFLDHYSREVIDFDHQAFRAPISPISHLLGIQIHIRKLEHDDYCDCPSCVRRASDNVHASFLMTDWDSTSGRFGEFLAGFGRTTDTAVGGVLCARVDKRDLPRQHVEAMALFSTRILQEVYSHALGDVEYGIRDQHSRRAGAITAVLQYATPEYFDAYFELLREERNKKFGDWVIVSTPYGASDFDAENGQEKKDRRERRGRELRELFNEMGLAWGGAVADSGVIMADYPSDTPQVKGIAVPRRVSGQVRQAERKYERDASEESSMALLNGNKREDDA